MTNTASANLGWEIAGGKKAVRKPADVKSSKTGSKDLVKFPKQEALQPIKLEKTIYDYIRESDDDDDDTAAAAARNSDFMDELNNNKVKTKTAANKKEKEISNGSTSPKSKKPQQQSESINLLASSIMTTQKKKPTMSTKATPEQEFEAVLAQISLDELEKEHNNLVALFPSNWLTINQHLAIFLNQKLSHVSDFDPNSSHENETVSLLSKADIKLTKFLNGAVSKLSRADAEKLFEILFQSLFTDSNKSPSNHGFKIYIQLLVKHSSPFELANTSKFNEAIYNNKHRYQRCLIALWALSQIGYANLANGIKIWFECMLPLLNTKGLTFYVATYLNSLLSHHKNGKTETHLIDLDRYDKLFDVIQDKSVNAVGKEASQKLKLAFDTLRANLIDDMNRSPDDYLELVLADLKVEQSPKQDDMLAILSSLLINNSKILLPKWKQIYSKYIVQSYILLEYLSRNELKAMKSMRSMGDTLRYFDEHSTAVLNKQAAAGGGQKDTKNAFYAKNKTNRTSESDQLRKFNKLVKQLISNHFGRTSRFSMVLRSFLLVALTVGFFFYWDINLNKSAYTKALEVELKKHGLLEPTLKLINSVKQLIWTIRDLLAYYIPLWYGKFNKTVVPALVDAWSVSKEYVQIAWMKTGPYRELVIVYVNQAVDFIHENFPVVMKNLISVVQLVIHYATTLFNFGVYYVNIAIDFIGTQLLGMKKGELEKVFLDGIKVSLEFLAQLLQKLTAYLNQK